MLNAYNTFYEVEQSNCDTALISLASVEAKGTHLPVGADLLIADEFSYQYAKDKNVYLTPTIPYGTSEALRGFKGTVWLGNETLWSILFDLVECLKVHGFRRIIVFNFCSYNWVVKPAIREINLRIGDCNVVWVEPKQIVKELLFDELGKFSDYHAGALDTSLMLHIRGEVVGEQMEDCLPDFGREYLDYMGMKPISPKAVWGKPSLASKQLGEKLFDSMLERTEKYVDDVLSLFPNGNPVERSDTSAIYVEGEPDSTITSWMDSFTKVERNTDMVIFPISSIEQHSYCLPLGTDYFQSLKISESAAKNLDAYLLPSFPIISAWEHIGFRGTLTLQATTARKLIMDVVNSLYQTGFRKIVLTITHGGNWIAKPTLIELNVKYEDLTLIYAGGDPLSYRGKSPVTSLHTGSGEAAFIMDYYPECFKKPVKDGTPKVPASYLDYVGVKGVSPDGVWGFPSRARKGDGIRRIESAGKSIANYVNETIEKIFSMHVKSEK